MQSCGHCVSAIIVGADVKLLQTVGTYRGGEHLDSQGQVKPLIYVILYCWAPYETVNVVDCKIDKFAKNSNHVGGNIKGISHIIPKCY